MLEVRDSEPEDFDEVSILLKRVWGEAEYDMEEMRHDYMEYIESDRDFSFCAHDEGQITGYCATSMRKSMQFPGEMLYIDVLVVREGFRKTGVGEKLLERAFKLADELGCRAIHLDIGFQRTGEQDFYKQQGFKQIGMLFGKPV